MLDVPGAATPNPGAADEDDNNNNNSCGDIGADDGGNDDSADGGSSIKSDRADDAEIAGTPPHRRRVPTPAPLAPHHQVTTTTGTEPSTTTGAAELSGTNGASPTTNAADVAAATATATAIITAATTVGPRTIAAVHHRDVIQMTMVPTLPHGLNHRRSWITTERMNELRRSAQEAVKTNRTFTIRGCFNSIRSALLTRGWVEKLDIHRKQIPTGVCQVTYEDLAQALPKRRAGETRRAYIGKCERNIMSRFLEHMPIDFLWTNRKEKCDYIDQAKNPGMIINKFHRAPFTTKEGLCTQLRDFHWFYEAGTAELYFPRCFNVWSPEELGEFVDNYRLTACIGYLRCLVDRYRERGYDAIFSSLGKIPLSSVDFAFKRCTEHIDSCEHQDIDLEPPKTWDHDWEVFLQQHGQLANEGARLHNESPRLAENVMQTAAALLKSVQLFWPQYSLDGYQNLWIVKPANKCRGRGIQLLDNLKKIVAVVNPPTASKSRYVVQKYIERPLIIHHTKFDIRQWFLITNVQPLVLWMYKESYLRFSSQEYNLNNFHESVHLTNHAIQKKYTNGKRDKRLPAENMWDCYSFQAYLRQIGMQHMWLERIYPGMRKAIVGTMLASQENMDRRPNTFELFGADFMICEDFYPWLIEINSSPDLGATTSVTARMCPQCLEDVIKVVIDRRADPKADFGNFELIYRQIIPATPAYMGLNLFVKGKQIMNGHRGQQQHQQHPTYAYHRKERSLSTSNFYRHRTAFTPATISSVHRVMPTFNATEFIARSMTEALNSSRSSLSGTGAGSVPSAGAGGGGGGAGGGTNTTSTLSAIRQFTSMYSLASSATQRTAPSLCSAAATTAPPSPGCPCALKTTQTQAQVNRIRRKTYMAPATAQPATKGKSATGKTATEAAGSSASHAGLPSKRHRSCGPRLNGNNHASTEADKKFKFIIKKWAVVQQKDDSKADCPPAEPKALEQETVAVKADVTPPPTPPDSLKLRHQQSRNNHPGPMEVVSGSTARHSGRHRHRCRLTALAMAAAAAGVSANKQRRAVRHSSTTNAAARPQPDREANSGNGTVSASGRRRRADMHAIGRGITTWKSASRHNLSRMAAAARVVDVGPLQRNATSAPPAATAVKG